MTSAQRNSIRDLLKTSDSRSFEANQACYLPEQSVLNVFLCFLCLKSMYNFCHLHFHSSHFCMHFKALWLNKQAWLSKITLFYFMCSPEKSSHPASLDHFWIAVPCVLQNHNHFTLIVHCLVLEPGKRFLCSTELSERPAMAQQVCSCPGFSYVRVLCTASQLQWIKHELFGCSANIRRELNKNIFCLHILLRLKQ